MRFLTESIKSIYFIQYINDVIEVIKFLVVQVIVYSLNIPFERTKVTKIRIIVENN